MASKLVHIITHRKNTNALTKKLVGAKFLVTVMEAQGGFTKEKFSVSMLATEESKIEEIVKIVKSCCAAHKEMTVNSVPIPTLGQEDLVQGRATKSVSVKIGGATILISPLDRIAKA